MSVATNLIKRSASNVELNQPEAKKNKADCDLNSEDIAILVLSKFNQPSSQEESISELKNKLVTDYRSKDFSSAYQTCEKILTIEPESTFALQYRAKISSANDENIAALIVLDKLIEKEPENLSFLWQRVKLFAKLEYINDITADLQKILDLDNNFPKALKGIHLLLNVILKDDVQDFDSAFNFNATLLENDPTNLEALDQKLEIFFLKNEEADEFEELLDKISEKNSNWDFLLGAYNSMLNEDIESCLDLASEFEKKEGKKFFSAYLKGKALLKLADFESARTEFAFMCTKYPYGETAIKKLIAISIQQKKYQEALEIINEQPRKYPYDLFMQRSVGICQYFLKNYQEAYTAFEGFIDQLDSLELDFCLQSLLKISQDETWLKTAYFAFQRFPENFKIRLTSLPSSLSRDPFSEHVLTMIDMKEQKMGKVFERLSLTIDKFSNFLPAYIVKGTCLYKQKYFTQSNSCFNDFFSKYLANTVYPSEKKELILKVWERKKVIFRPLLADDFPRFAKFFNVLHTSQTTFNTFHLDEFHKLADNHGILNSCEIMVIQAPHSLKIKAVVQTYTYEDFCNIELIHTAKKYENQGLASLLLNFTIRQALLGGHNRLTLNTSKEGAPLYFSYGFEPVSDKLKNQIEGSLSITEKTEMLFSKTEDEFPTLKLDLRAPDIQERLNKKLENTLSKPFQRIRKLS
jgi:GNAT superfamily N-acetyltransferase